MPAYPRRRQINGSTGPELSWAQVAAGAIVVAIALAAALVVVASINGADTLSTVALALAVLAFTTQILVFVADAWTTSRLNSETHGLLREVRTRAQGTEKALGRQVDTLTKHLIERVERQYKDGAESPGELRRWIGDEVETTLQNAGYAPPESYGPSMAEPETEPSEEDRRITLQLESFPEEETGLAMLQELEALHPVAVSTLGDFARDETVSRQLGAAPYMRLRPHHPFTDELIEKGFVEPTEIEEEDEGTEFARLTEKGRSAARLIVAPKRSDEVPQWLWDRGGQPSTG